MSMPNIGEDADFKRHSGMVMGTQEKIESALSSCHSLKVGFMPMISVFMSSGRWRDALLPVSSATLPLFPWNLRSVR